MTERGTLYRRVGLLGLAAASLASLGAAPRTGGGPPGPVARAPAHPDSVPPDLLAGLVWRNIGPLRAGRVAAVSGAIGEPGVFYAGMPAGGVWKTGDAGVSWRPIFDSVRSVSSVGAVAVAPSDTSVVYVGTGDIITGGNIDEGDGVYKSTDAGRTWRHIGLGHTRQIPSILVDPSDPNLVLVAAQGDIHHKTDARGVFRSTDGGRTWTKTLFVNDSTGIERLARAYDAPKVVFAMTVRHYRAPGAPRGKFYFGAETGTYLYRSIDEGATWQRVTGGGLPKLEGRMSVAVAMHTNAQRVFVVGDSGLYRSDDGGSTWRRMDPDDPRIRTGQGGYNCGVYVSPSDPDIVYTVNTSSYVSTDGGATFTGFRGAPGGDDPQQMWIDPTDGQRILLGMDQGATVSLDGGRSWSPWYNQSTEQVYHVSTDTSWPYWVYAPQQDAGAIRVRSRGNFGEITPLDWSPVGGWEWGTVIADPLDPKEVYSSNGGAPSYASITRITWPSEQTVNVSPQVDPEAHLRSTSTNPIAFAPWNPHELLAGFQVLMATTDGGAHWRKLSPDLGVPAGVKPPGEGPDSSRARSGSRRGAIESISPSTVKQGLIWVGTSNGLVKLTRDGGRTWEDVSIPDLPDSSYSDISAVDASHQDPAEAYVAVDAHGLGDYAPYLYRTRDYGKTWTKIVDGLPTGLASGSFARVIRADTEKRGLLFAGTESSMYVSFDDGDHWQSLRLNLPITSFRDATIHGHDLVVGTYGRGIWILDDLSPLRQMTASLASEPAHLFAPGDAVRVRRNVNRDTPFHPEVPHSLNPPPGALIYYSLRAAPQGTVTLDILDAAGHVVRHLSSAPVEPGPEYRYPPEPNHWLEWPEPLPTKVGLDRVSWDVRYDDPPAFHRSFDINANPGLTPPSPQGPLALPGTYAVRLTVDGRSYTQTVKVTNDPRSPASEADLEAQHALEMRIFAGIREAWNGHAQAAAMDSAVVRAAGTNPPPALARAARAFEARLDSVAGREPHPGESGGSSGRSGPPPPDFVRENGALVQQLERLETGDLAPTGAMEAAYAHECGRLAGLVTRWRTLNVAPLQALNGALRRAHLEPVAAARELPIVPDCGAGG
ncbi:MAG: hypothetical protein Q8W51_05395 [Candidatus Palauibacterales bacterium]|nr:hypothetical protein [Candidatus Palauibacterales bacterium]MDP2583902.1 hypothetical protein [Candidatus Palauibacterales bacterium]